MTRRTGRIKFDHPINITKTDDDLGIIEFEYEADGDCSHSTIGFETGAQGAVKVEFGGDGCPIDPGGIHPIDEDPADV